MFDGMTVPYKNYKEALKSGKIGGSFLDYIFTNTGKSTVPSLYGDKAVFNLNQAMAEAGKRLNDVVVTIKDTDIVCKKPPSGSIEKCNVIDFPWEQKPTEESCIYKLSNTNDYGRFKREYEQSDMVYKGSS
jgi:hypothetical protein